MTRRFLSSSAFSLVVSLAALTLGGCASSAEEKPVELVRPPVEGEVAAYTQLEKRVVALEGQMHEAQPTLKKVEAMEIHFKALSLELDKIAKEYPEAEAPKERSVAPVVRETLKKEPAKAEPVLKKEDLKVNAQDEKPAEKMDEKKAETAPAATPVSAPVSADELAVTSVRIGEQGKETTRIVLDTTKAAELRYDLDNGEGLLVIDIPNAKWSATDSSVLKKSPMVKSFHANSDDAGSHLVIELKQSAKVTATARLNPSGASGHRVYVDVAPAK